MCGPEHRLSRRAETQMRGVLRAEIRDKRADKVRLDTYNIQNLPERPL